MLWLMLMLAVPPEPKGLRLTVTSAQRMADAPGFFRPVARVHDPKQELQCPSFEWIWHDEGSSKIEPDCDPYGSYEDRKTLWVIQPTKAYMFRFPGEYNIGFVVTAGDRVLRDSVTVIVNGMPK